MIHKIAHPTLSKQYKKSYVTYPLNMFRKLKRILLRVLLNGLVTLYKTLSMLSRILMRRLRNQSQHRIKTLNNIRVVQEMLTSSPLILGLGKPHWLLIWRSNMLSKAESPLYILTMRWQSKSFPIVLYQSSLTKNIKVLKREYTKENTLPTLRRLERHILN